MIPGLPTEAVCLFKIKQIWSVQPAHPLLCDCLNKSIHNRQLGWCASIKEQRSPGNRSVTDNLQSLRIKRKVRQLEIQNLNFHVLQNNTKRRQRRNSEFALTWQVWLALRFLAVLLVLALRKRLAALLWTRLGSILKLDGLVDAVAMFSAVWLSKILCWLVQSVDKSWPAALSLTVLGQNDISASWCIGPVSLDSIFHGSFCLTKLSFWCCSLSHFFYNPTVKK